MVYITDDLEKIIDVENKVFPIKVFKVKVGIIHPLAKPGDNVTYTLESNNLAREGVVDELSCELGEDRGIIWTYMVGGSKIDELSLKSHASGNERAESRHFYLLNVGRSIGDLLFGWLDWALPGLKQSDSKLKLELLGFSDLTDNAQAYLADRADRRLYKIPKNELLNVDTPYRKT